MSNLESHELKLLLSLGVVLALWLVRWLFKWLIGKRFRIAEFSKARHKIIMKSLNIIYAMVLLSILAGIWGLEGTRILTFITSVLTVLGIGFFAQWSLLSNITSGLLLYFNHPLKIGDYIKIVDKDTPLSGRVEDISLFFLHVRDAGGVVFTLPNTSVMQKMLTISSKPFPKEDPAESID